MSIDFSQDYEAPLVTTSFTPADESEFSLRPKRLTEYNGQEKVKENLSVYIEAARRRNEPLDHVLLYGPPGLGKTTLAGIIANEMGVSIRVTSGPAIEKAGRSGRAADEPELRGRHPLYRRDPPPQPRRGGGALPRHGGLCHRHHHRQGALGQVHPARSAALSRSSAPRPAPGSSPPRCATASACTLPAGALYARRSWPASSRARRALLGVEIDEGGALEIAAPVPRHAAHRQPHAQAACATSPSVHDDGRITREVARPGARHSWRSTRSGLDATDRPHAHERIIAQLTAAGPWGWTRSPRPSGEESRHPGGRLRALSAADRLPRHARPAGRCVTQLAYDHLHLQNNNAEQLTL